MHNKGGTRCDTNPRLHHDLIDNLWVSLHLKFSLLCDVHETREECFARDSKMIKFEVSVVDGIVAEFSAHVSYLYAMERLMIL